MLYQYGKMVGAASLLYNGVGAGSYSNRNLLDNWYFKNPVNQRRVSGVINKSGYFIDRWYLVSGSVKITENGLVLNGQMVQALEYPIGVSTIATAYSPDGDVEATYDDSTQIFSIEADGKVVVSAKLEAGDTQTLIKSDGMLNDPPPNFEQELAKCQRYFVREYGTGSYTPIANVHTWETSRFEGVYYLPVSMRKTPTFNSSGDFEVWYNSKSVQISKLSGAFYRNTGLRVFYFMANPSKSVTLGDTGILGMFTASSYIEFDADMPIAMTAASAAYIKDAEAVSSIPEYAVASGSTANV